MIGRARGSSLLAAAVLVAALVACSKAAPPAGEQVPPARAPVVGVADAAAAAAPAPDPAPVVAPADAAPPPPHDAGPRVVRPKKDPAAPPVPAPRGDPGACSQDSDCVLSCPTAPGCCGWPCGCKHAIHKDHKAAYEASYARTCDKAPCPVVGCARQDAHSAICRNGRCRGVEGLGGF